MTTALTRPTRDVAWLRDQAGPLITPAAFCEVARLDRLTAERILDEGILPTVSIGGTRRRIPRAALLNYLGLDTSTDTST